MKTIWWLGGILVIYLAIYFLIFGCDTRVPEDSQNSLAPVLTKEQKVEDVKYFFDFIRASYPFIEAMEREKKLGCFYDHEEIYIERAKETNNNLEFMSLFIEMMQRIKQGTGHADVAPPFKWNDDSEMNDKIAKYGISLDSFHGQIEWWELFNKIKSFMSISCDCGFISIFL